MAPVRAAVSPHPPLAVIPELPPSPPVSLPSSPRSPPTLANTSLLPDIPAPPSPHQHSSEEAPAPASALQSIELSAEQALQRTCPNPARLSMLKEHLKRIEAVGYKGNLEGVLERTGELLAEFEPTMPSHHFSTQLSAAAVNATSKRMMSEPMGSSRPTKQQKLMRATNTTTRQTKSATAQVWAGMKQVGRPKSRNVPTFPELPKQPQPGICRGSGVMAAMLQQGAPANFSPLIMKKSKQRVKEVGCPNVELYALNASDVPSFISMPQPFVVPSIPDAPSEHMARAVYIQSWAPIAHTFQQGTQPWHALRAATCTASNIASLLGLQAVSECSASFSKLFGVQAEVSGVSQVNHFHLQWGMRHELNGVASVLDNFPTISAHIASKLNISFPPTVQAHEQGSLFVPPTHALLHGTVFGTPYSPYAIAASPDAKLVADGGSAVLLEVKSVCPFTEKDDGRGWVWCPYKKALCDKGVSAKHFVQCQVQMLAANMSHCLLVGWEVEECHIVCLQFDGIWCRHMLSMLSSILLAAAPLSGGCPKYSSIPEHKRFVEYTQNICDSVPRLCSVKSVKGAVHSRWL